MDLTRFTSTLRPHILVARHPTHQRHFFDVLLHWARDHHPALLDLFFIVEFPHVPADLSSTRLLVPWLQDPVQAWSPDTYRWADDLASACRARNIPVINPVDRLLNATKSRGAALIASAGLRVPRMARIAHPAEFHDTLLNIPLPLFVREDWGHHSLIYSAHTRDEARAIPLHAFERPVAIELVDVRSPDGLYRKYRYLAAGPHGVSHHLQATTDWVTRGDRRVVNDTTRAEELAYIATQDPHHAAFQRAAQALNLPFITFDYALLPDGSPIVWEANPFPFIQFAKAETKYRNHALHRSVAAILRFYLETALLPVPDTLRAQSEY